MHQNIIELNKHQRELILEGLRYLRSSRRFEFRPTSAPPDPRRENDLQEIAGLMQHMEAASESPVQARL